ncbi:ABC transporter ATP-binding protein [Streptomyces sp. NPDC056291]|uniref:ABC transporter ATP-binding protein n=1 Tax=Streptomyces sp. NPDC056291 TaxID=3345772 RepID=UPI0035D6D5C1
MSDHTPVVEVTELRKVFRVRRPDGRGTTEFTAVDGVGFQVRPGGALAIVGESGSGKSTVARMVVGLETPTSGSITVLGRPRKPGRAGTAERRRRGREIQMVFQDPYGSLNRRRSVRDALGEVIDLHFKPSRNEREERIARLLADVGLDERQSRALPSALSGGQRQRVAIARALAAEPKVLVLDEAVAALDVSIQAQILNLLADIRERTGLTYLFISHDLSVVRQISEEAIVMRKGRIVESGPTARILDDPQHPYTRMLRRSVPGPGWKPRRMSQDERQALAMEETS